MRRLLAAAAMAGLIVGAGTVSRAADDKDKASQQQSTQTVYGTVAGVTTEGEMIVDYQAKKAVEAEAACLTVVGSTARWDAHAATGKEHADSGKQAAHAGHHRDNVFFVWITPKTKVCESEHATDTSKTGAKKECPIDHLEVGDRVEIQFRAHEPSMSRSTAGANHTDAMRRKHGRHRIQVGEATEITIIAAPHHEPGSSK